MDRPCQESFREACDEKVTTASAPEPGMCSYSTIFDGERRCGTSAFAGLFRGPHTFSEFGTGATHGNLDSAS